MTKAPGETEGTRTRGSITRRMLITAAILSAIVLAAAGRSLQALYRSEQDRQLNNAIEETICSLTNAADFSTSGEFKPDPTKLPKAEQFDMTLSGRYWAYLFIDRQNEIVDGLPSRSFANM